MEGDNQILYTNPQERLELNELELFQKAMEVDRGNMYAREKLAQIELRSENYLKAALQFEAILDFIQAEGCYNKARDSPEKFE